MARRSDVTESLKAIDSIAWVQKMNNIQNAARKLSGFWTISQGLPQDGSSMSIIGMSCLPSAKIKSYMTLGDTCNLKAGKSIAAAEIPIGQSADWPFPCYGGNKFS